jgi:hypothetical protein
VSGIATPLRVPLAREHLRQRFALAAGVDPGSGFFIGDARLEHRDDAILETDDERRDRLAYLQTFRDRAVSAIAGLMGGSHIRVWRDRDGTLEIAAPLWADRNFFDQNGEADDLYFERAEWQALLAVRYPAQTTESQADGHAAVEPGRVGWSEAEFRTAIAKCEISNRDRAWREVFEPIRQQHGYDNETFRTLWSEARGTKGMRGRPPAKD